MASELPSDIADLIRSLVNQAQQNCYMDLTALSGYSAIGVSTLRDHIRRDGLPSFRIRGKTLVKRSEFDLWLEKFRVHQNKKLDTIANDVMKEIEG